MKKKPDAYMPYFGADLETACKGYSPALKWALVSCLWHYWSHTHCRGLPDDDDYLRNLCECPPQDWPRTKPIIFGKFFTLQNGAWHQDRCKQEHEKSVRIGQIRRKVGKTGADARWHTDSKPDDKTEGKKMPCAYGSGSSSGSGSGSGGVGGASPATVFEDVKGQLCGLYKRENRRLSHLEESILAEICRGERPQAELAEILAYREAIPPNDRHFFPNTLQSLVEKWQPTLDRARAGAVSAGSAVSASVLAVNHGKELDRALAEIAAIKNRAGQDVFGARTYTADDKKRLGVLIARRNELRKLLGVTV